MYIRTTSLAFVLIFHNAFGTQHWNQFCDFECGTEHTVCKHRCGVGIFCTYGVEVFDLTEKERSLVLDVHNKYRNDIAMGGKSESAANMIALEYDEDLEYVAKCWGKQCISDHDNCRSTTNYSYVGQNMFKQWLNIGNNFNESECRNMLLKTDKLLNGVDVWYKEVRYMLPKQYERFHVQPSQPSIEHFTQLVWAKTERVGCARVIYKSNSRVNMLFICNYGPGGNYENAPVYEFGRGASRCPNGWEPSSIYPGLCSKRNNTTDVNTVVKCIVWGAITLFVLRCLCYH